ncbi:MAG: hypothetical protein A2V77_24150 [Anaeromyxobacter sp. RBG_16_69_14]|nr:MAG: hypothetical protein A2V77_24150 [Anaeromyxobacter sp. RBG_16_69_14]
MVATGAEAIAALVARHGDGQRARVERGVAQVKAMWRPTDGDAGALRAFLESQFVSDPEALASLLGRFEEALEALDGGFVEQNRALARHAVLDLGPMLEVDKLLSAFDAGAHVTDDLFDSKLAFVALLNFPLTTLDERLREGERWSRRRWAEVRLTNRFARRVPAAVNQQIARASAEAELYVADDNIYVHHVLVDGKRLFPKGMRLLSHWNLRDQIKADYATKDGLPRQRAIAKVMERIVAQTIPASVVNDPGVDWDPVTTSAVPAPAVTIETGAQPPTRVDPAREPDTRYARLLGTFRAAKAADPYSPTAPTHIARKFELEREIPEARVSALLKEVLESPLVPRIAKRIEARLGRKLEPFDIWYDGFRPRSRFGEAELDRATKQRYPTAESLQRDLPNVLEKLGFTVEKARWLSARIVVEPARGSGHALAAGRRGDFPHLRTRVGKDGMDYKGFNIAIHELGHNVEQVFSLYEVDHTLLAGVPNTAVTEALAFVFQARDLEVLGLATPDAEAQRLLALNDLWMTYEIAGVALVDMGVWRWMYAHPQASPAELREATLRIAREIWNRYYAPVLGVRDTPLLAIYSHMVSSFLYLPDYPLGHLIAAQIEEHLRGAKSLGAEFERMASYGAVTPDLWMKNATGAPVGTAALLGAAERALVGEEGKKDSKASAPPSR